MAALYKIELHAFALRLALTPSPPLTKGHFGVSLVAGCYPVPLDETGV